MNLSEYLKNAKYFSLGHLPTEGFHPLTRNLSSLTQNRLDDAIHLVRRIDLEAISKIKSNLPIISKMQADIQAALNRGNRIFLSGCGATGRLALALETTWRKTHQGTSKVNSVQALMAGGDFALVKSVENFEDFPEYGVRHLADLGFKEGDLLIAITEGGETPYVIGTAIGAMTLSKINPWFVYCNPREVLCATVERSREIIENPRVQNLCLPIGEMALSGSTRLQAATVQMFAVGLALFNESPSEKLIDTFSEEYSKLDLASFLKPVIEWESSCYLKNETVIYRTDTYPIAVLTDTTERSPTFSLVPFEKPSDTKGPFSLCYLSIPGAHTSLEAWKAILNRTPVGLEWPELNGRLGLDSILEFNFGREAIAARAARISPLVQKELHIDQHATLQQIEIKSEGLDVSLSSSLVSHPLLEQILIKVLLNTLSLMVMGLLNRYEGNVMTWVRPSNGKLIDRTIRYLEFLIQKRGIKFDVYASGAREVLAAKVFAEQATIRSDEAVILNVLKKFD